MAAAWWWLGVAFFVLILGAAIVAPIIGWCRGKWPPDDDDWTNDTW